MANPTIEKTGTSNGLFRIVDHNGNVHRIPINALCKITDSSNPRVFRLDVNTTNDELTLIFETATARDNFLTTFEGFY